VLNLPLAGLPVQGKRVGVTLSGCNVATYSSGARSKAPAIRMLAK
jgi:hypothetical protein